MVAFFSNIIRRKTKLSRGGRGLRDSRHLSATLFVMLLMLFLLAQPVTGGAATYYIDYQAGSDNNNGTSKATPWQRCPGMQGFGGAYTHQNGDIFVFKGGVRWTDTYPQTSILLDIANSGSATNPDQYIVDKTWYAGAVWDYPIFDGNATWGEVGVRVANKSNVVIDSLKLVNMASTDGFGFGIQSYGVSNVEIRNCIFDCMCVDWVSLGPSPGGRKYYFHHNTVRNSGRMHISIGAEPFDDIQIHHNTFEGFGTFTNKGYHGDGLMIGAENTSGYSMTNLQIYNNKWFGNWSDGATALIFLEGAYDKFGGQHARIYNNQVAADSNGVFSPGLIDASVGWDDVKVYNNTVAINAPTNVPPWCIFAAGNSSNWDIQNNILQGCDNAIGIFSSVPSIVRNNLYYTVGASGSDPSYNHFVWDAAGRYNSLQELQSRGYETNSNAGSVVGVDPKFVAQPNGTWGSGNWHLQSSSPAIGAGVNLGTYLTTDLEDRSRPSGAWTIGAYEGLSGPAGISAPKNLRIAVP